MGPFLRAPPSPTPTSLHAPTLTPFPDQETGRPTLPAYLPACLLLTLRAGLWAASLRSCCWGGRCLQVMHVVLPFHILRHELLLLTVLLRVLNASKTQRKAFASSFISVSNRQGRGAPAGAHHRHPRHALPCRVGQGAHAHGAGRGAPCPCTRTSQQHVHGHGQRLE